MNEYSSNSRDSTYATTTYEHADLCARGERHALQRNDTRAPGSRSEASKAPSINGENRVAECQSVLPVFRDDASNQVRESFDADDSPIRVKLEDDTVARAKRVPSLLDARTTGHERQYQRLAFVRCDGHRRFRRRNNICKHDVSAGLAGHRRACHSRDAPGASRENERKTASAQYLSARHCIHAVPHLRC